MQLCGSARFQGSDHNFVPCSQPVALFVLLLSVGLLHVTEFTSSSGNESVCQGQAWYLLRTTVGCCPVFAAFRVCAGFLLLLMHFLAHSWLLE